MDTGTHVVMGFGLYALSSLDPIASLPHTSDAVLLGMVAGSVIPDIDTVLKLKDNATYIRHHRGITHSIPATLLWPILITGILYLIFNQADWLHLWLWSFLAVFLHVFVDIFNAYGTQALRPLSRKWIALGIINIFDPVIFGLHIAGFVFWYFIGYSGYIFLMIYIILIGYYFLRIYQYQHALSIVRHQLRHASIYLSPTMHWRKYHVAARNASQYVVGEVDRKHFIVLDQFERKDLPNHPAVQAALKDKNVKAFLSFSPIYRFEFKGSEEMFEIRFIDLRYLTKGHYPFVAVARVNKQMEVVSSFTGWIYNKEKLEKKLSLRDDYNIEPKAP
ncbi:MAG: metal-dependent hydrolase [Tuberibacillus sp.]